MPKIETPQITKMNLRMPEALHTSIKIEAAKNRRSVNDEVMRHLKKLYEPYQPETN